MISLITIIIAYHNYYRPKRKQRYSTSMIILIITITIVIMNHNYKIKPMSQTKVNHFQKNRVNISTIRFPPLPPRTIFLLEENP